MAKKKTKSTNFDGIKADFVIGLDMSLTSTGWASYAVNDDYLNSGFIDVQKSKLTGIQRLIWIRDQIKELFEIARINTEGAKIVVFIEGYAFAARGRAGISLAELGGVVRILMGDQRIMFVEVPPATLKKFITGVGNSDKAVMNRELYRRYGHLIDQNDQADAVALVELGRGALGIPSRTLVGFQQTVLSTL